MLLRGHDVVLPETLCALAKDGAAFGYGDDGEDNDGIIPTV
jgi:hypothetical protein